MKILFLTPWYPDDKNANHGIFIRDQAVALQRVSEVIVVSAKVDYADFNLFSYRVSECNFRNVTEYHISIKRSLPVFNQLVLFFIVTRETLRIARRFLPDIIHGNIGYPGAFWAFLVSRIIRRPYVITEHTSRFTANFRSYLHKSLTLFSLRKAGAVISVSTHSAAEVARYINRQPVVIPNIIDFEKFPEVSGISNRIWQIGFIGNLNTNTKGLDILLRALAEIQFEFRLHIGGTGKLLEEYKSLAKELKIDHKSIFYEFVPHTQVHDFMKRLHFFVSASRFESFGMVMVEAMACGLPVVAAASGGPSDFINASNGILVQKENPSALRLGIETMIRNYNTYDPGLIRSFALANYSAKNFIEKINKVYNSIIQHR